MAYYATSRFTYWGQLGILTLFCGIGLVLGGIFSMIPLLGIVDIFHAKGSASQLMDSVLKPENATAIRWMQLITTTFLFFLPPVIYARVCHLWPAKHLGFNQEFNRTMVFQLGLIFLIIVASTPFVDMLQQVTQQFPWSKVTLQKFSAAEADYYKQIMVIARMNNLGDYVISMIMVALLPAVFEETLFRGGIQNLLSRWMKMPVLAIIITSIIFSAVHGSYLGFLSRFALGFVLGWIYYRTGNIWLNITAHFINNGMALTSLYFSSKSGIPLDPAKMNEHSPLWLGAMSGLIVLGLLVFFERISKGHLYQPGKEVMMPFTDISNNPFEQESESIGHQQ